MNNFVVTGSTSLNPLSCDSLNCPNQSFSSRRILTKQNQEVYSYGTLDSILASADEIISNYHENDLEWQIRKVLYKLKRSTAAERYHASKRIQYTHSCNFWGQDLRMSFQRSVSLAWLHPGAYVGRHATWCSRNCAKAWLLTVVW